MSEKDIEIAVEEDELKAMIAEAVKVALEEKAPVKEKVEEKVEEPVEEKKQEETEMKKEEVKEMVVEALKEVKGESKMVHEAPAVIKERGEGKRSFGEMLKGVYFNDKNIIAKYALVQDEKVLLEGTGSLGGYLVPEEFRQTLIDLTASYSIIRPLCQVIPMSGKTLTMPSLTANGATYWVDENGAKTESNVTFGQVSLTNYKLCRLQKVSKELLDDSNPSIDSILMNVFAKSLANAEDLAFIAGTGAAGDPITGILNTAGMPTTAAGAFLSFDDVFDAINSVEVGDGRNITLVAAPRDKKTLRKLKGNDGQYLWASASEKAPATIDGYPIVFDKNIPTTLGVGVESALIVGDFDYAYIGDRQGVTISSGLDQDDFSKNRISFLAEKRVGFKVADVNKFNVITGVLSA